MKKAFLFLIVMWWGQAMAQLTVEVRDEHTDQIVTQAHVFLQGNKDTLAAISDEAGLVLFEKPFAGKLLVTHVSYANYEQGISGIESRIKLYISPQMNGLDEVVVTGQARATRVSESVRSVRVLDAKRIEEQGAVNLKDLLTYDPTIRINEDAILGSQISLQGLSGSKVKILIDGVPIIGRIDGNIDLSQINLNDIDRVEIVEGPMAVQYGTDAMAGTINLITKSKAVSKTTVQVNGYYETVGRYNIDGNVSIPMGKWQAGVGLGRYFFDGYDADESRRNVQWNPKEQYFANASVQRRFNKVLVRYRTDFFDERISNLGNVGSIDSLITPVDTGAWKYPRSLDDEFSTLRFNNALFADYYPSSDKKVKVFVAYNYYQRIKTTVVKNLNTGEEILFAGDGAQDTSIFTTLSSRMFYQHDWKPKKFSYQFGYDFEYEVNKGRRLQNEFENITNIAVFSTAEYQPVKSLNIQPGLRYAYNNRFEAPLIGSLAARYQMNEKWILRGSFGQGFRAPSLKELYYTFVDENHNILGNENLQAEASNNYQLSLQYASNYKRLTVETNLSGFFNDINNEIRMVSVETPDDDDPRGLFRYENIAQTQTTGGTLSIKGIRENLQFETSFTTIGVKNELAFDQSAQSEGLDGFNFYPQIGFNVNYTITKWKLRPAVFINYTGQRTDLILDANSDLTNTVFDAYTMADVTLQKSFLKDKIRLTLGAKNLFNVTNINASVSSHGAHSTGDISIPLSYGTSFFTRLQIDL